MASSVTTCVAGVDGDLASRLRWCEIFGSGSRQLAVEQGGREQAKKSDRTQRQAEAEADG